MNDRLYIFDTTLRDGEQVPGCQLNTVEKIQVAKHLEALGVDVIKRSIARATGIPLTKQGLERKIGRTLVKTVGKLIK